MLLLWYGRNVARELKNVCFLKHMREIFPTSYEGHVIMTTCHKCSPCATKKKRELGHIAEMCFRVTKETLFRQHDRNALLVLQEKYYFGHIAWMFSSCGKRNVISSIWQRCYALVQKVFKSFKRVHSAHRRHIADMYSCKLNLFPPCVCCVKKQCYVWHISRTAT